MQRSDLARWASFPMRVLVGFGFIEHGVAKLSRGPDAFAGILQQMGVPLPHIAALLTIGSELVGGLQRLPEPLQLLLWVWSVLGALFQENWRAG
jgi:putative oxidoreductase